MLTLHRTVANCGTFRKSEEKYPLDVLLSRLVTGKHQTPPGKIPLDYLLYMREIKGQNFAERIGVSGSRVSAFRRGLRPPLEIQERIAKELDVTREELGWEEPSRV